MHLERVCGLCEDGTNPILHQKITGWNAKLIQNLIYEIAKKSNLSQRNL
jgi:hypothetical protein